MNVATLLRSNQLPADWIPGFKGNSTFRSGIQAVALQLPLWCQSSRLFLFSAGSEMPCSGRDDEIWSASKKKIRFVELPVNSSRRRGKQHELNRIAVKDFRRVALTN